MEHELFEHFRRMGWDDLRTRNHLHWERWRAKWRRGYQIRDTRTDALLKTYRQLEYLREVARDWVAVECRQLRRG